MYAIDVRNIVKKFGEFTAVKGISFTVDEGEIFGLLGPNGAGKSTLIRMLVTLLPPTMGTALINGFDVVKQSDGVRQSIGVIPQAMTSDLELSVEENLIIFAKLYGVPKPKRERLINELLEAVELTQWRHAQVKNLSGGMRRRVEIARGLVHEPRIFFLDEPTTGLDPVSRVAVWEMLEKIKRERNLTILTTLAYVTPLIGLLGTVTGMIDAFVTISSHSGLASSTEIAAGIYQSLLTTAASLVVAIPTAVAYSFLSSRVQMLWHVI